MSWNRMLLILWYFYCSWNWTVRWLHCRVQIHFWPPFLCNRRGRRERTYSGNSLARILWCRCSASQVGAIYWVLGSLIILTYVLYDALDILNFLFSFLCHELMFHWNQSDGKFLRECVDWWNLYCRNNVEKKSVLENLDLVLLCLDEIVDGGCVFWTLCTISELKIVWMEYWNGNIFAFACWLYQW